MIFLAFCNSRTDGNDADLLKSLVSRLERSHYAPKKIDDKFSEEVFNNVLKNLDNGKQFFMKSDIRAFDVHRTSIDDEILQGSFSFMNQVWDTFTQRINSAERWYREDLSAPISFVADETVETDDDKVEWPKNQAERREFWRKNTKLAVLERLHRKMEQQKEALGRKDSLVKQLPYDTLEARSRNEVLKSYNDWISRLRKFDHRDRVGSYLNSITEIFDPHTNYFAPQNKQNFDIAMSGQFEGIGATLSERDGYIKVERVMPGSASYRQGELKDGDVILKVAQGTGEPVDVVNMKIDDAIQLIRGKKGTEVRLTVKKPDGIIKVIPIIRDVVVLEDGYAKSFIVEEGGKKYGVINVPSFYADFNRRGGRSSGQDVRVELEKLQNEGVAGIILDLRNNGGGSLGDAIMMAGWFIDQGPVVQVKAREGRPEVLYDMMPGTVYDGPLAVMVNENSASASEIVAAALQDYKRALIIGPHSTHGKGTVQNFYGLDESAMFGGESKSGDVKMTIQKFYRINGGTTQLKGVVPDIMIPSNLDYIRFGEKELDYALGYDEIQPARYAVLGSAVNGNFEKAKNNADRRIAANPVFQGIEDYARSLDKDKRSTLAPLNMDKYAAWVKKQQEETKKVNELIKSSKEMDLKPIKMDIDAVSGDSTKMKMREEWFKPYKKDPSLYETVQVLKDIAS